MAGKGTAADPLRVGSSAEFDQCFQRGRASMEATPTEFHLYPGTYRTRGVWAYAAQSYMMLGSGEALIGAGSKRTTILFDVENAPYETDGKARSDNGMIWAGRYYARAIGMRVEGLCLDGQYTKLPTGKLINSGVRFFGSHSVCRDVGVVGVKGDPSPARSIECFPISTVNFDGGDDTDPTDGGDLVEDCWIRNVCPSAYVSAVSIGQRPLQGKRRIVQSVVQRVHVDSGTGNYFAFAFCHNVIIRDCSCRGVAQALYNDTDSVSNVIVEDSDFETEYSGLSLIAEAPNAFKEQVKVRRCRFTFAPVKNTDMSVVALIDRTKTNPITNISVDDCLVVSKSQQRLSAVSISAQLCSAVRFTDNVLDLAGTPYRHLPAPTPKECLTLEMNRFYTGGPCSTFSPLVAGS